MPNGFAHIVLYSWPLVAFLLFRSLPVRPALIWTIVAGYLLLPSKVGFDLPALPTVDKDLIPIISAALMCLIFARKNKPQHMTERPEGRTAIAEDTVAENTAIADLSFIPQRGKLIFWGLMGLAAISPILTALMNATPVARGVRSIAGLKPYDALAIGSVLLISILPFFLGRRYLASEVSQKLLLKILAIALLLYSVLIAYEIRMSPQINSMVYGFFPHSWIQHIRGNGFRPLVFMPHGLWLSILVAMASASAFAIWRCENGKIGSGKWLMVGVWLFAVLMFSKSLGALALAFIFCPIILFLGVRGQTLVAATFAAIVLVYPMMRSAGLVPVNTIYSAAQSIDDHRAESLLFRFDNEDRILAKARQKPLSGWGGWGRARVFDSRGRDVTTTDGYWVIIISENGWLGYIARFGLMCIPLIMLGLQRRKLQTSMATASLGIVLCIALIDLLPNATISPILWLIAGSVMGRYQTATLLADIQIAKDTAEETYAIPDHLRDVPEPVDGPLAAAPSKLHVRVPR
ncbi:O-antigen ligase family protein [Roseovarius sp. EL26]|uniref:O-antigen ligase family protein n=1 Tax=Roseovarius sp. EL26 TaxID=2126672 RepID=UPI000EA2B47D|nr:O-antigen ligase family protein [Roseovarius sp. EL26]